MIPLGTNIEYKKTPWAVVGLIFINVVVYFYECKLGMADPQALSEFFDRYGFMPQLLHEHVSLAVKVTPIYTHMFLHGGLLHLFGNMMYLGIFGPKLEDEFGSFNFLIFYFVSGFCAVFLYFLFFPHSRELAVGASGAVAGIMGAFFAMYPEAEVKVLGLFFILWKVIKIPAIYLLGLWVVYEIYLGLTPDKSAGVAANSASWAHAGGFVAGILFARWFVLSVNKIEKPE